jgi:hypothetical protein
MKLTIDEKLHIAYLIKCAYDQGNSDGQSEFLESEMSRGNGADGFNFDMAVEEIGGLNEYIPTCTEFLISYNIEADFDRRICYKYQRTEEIGTTIWHTTYSSVVEYEFFVAKTFKSQF